VVDGQSETQLDQVLPGLDYVMVVILPERDELCDLRARWSMHRFIVAKDDFEKGLMRHDYTDNRKPKRDPGLSHHR
jgi:hypothetical protein